jgi:hypothetical protein
MKTTLQVVLIVVGILILTWIAAALLGYLYIAIGVTILVVIVTAIVRLLNHAKSITKEPIKVSHVRAERDAEKMLKKLEKTSATQTDKK